MTYILNFIFKKRIKFKKYWWHRFAIVLSIILSIFFLCIFKEDLFYPYYKTIDLLSNRLTSELVTLDRFPLNQGEHISFYEEGVGGSVVEVYTESEFKTYCSNNLIEYINEILRSNSNIDTLMSREFSGNKFYSLNDYKQLILDKKIKCVNLDSIYYKYSKAPDNNLDFLNTNTDVPNLYITKFNYFKTIGYSISIIIAYVFISQLLFLIAYIIILYIAFGIKDN